MYHLFFLAQKNQVDRKEHSNGVNTPRRDNPQAGPESRPTLRLAQQSDQSAHIAVGYNRFGSDKGFPRFVVHVDCTLRIELAHETYLPLFYALCDYSMAFPRRRQIMMNSTTKARTPAMIRIVVTSILLA